MSLYLLLNGMVYMLGYIGNILLSVCALPLAISAIDRGYDKTPRLFLLLWFFGELLACVDAVINVGFYYPLFINYGINIITLLVIFKYHFYPREQS